MNYRSYFLICILLAGAVILSALTLNHSEPFLSAWTEGEGSPYTVVIDPGHGGEDGGATDSLGRKESEINLDISLRVRDLLHFLGVQTKMIREDDRSVSTQGDTIAQRKVSDIRTRVELTESTPNALLLSIHQNHFSQSQYRGAQVFYAQTQGSEVWAKSLQERICTDLDPNNHRQAKESADVYLLKHIHCPAILVECGFLSNFEEATLLQTSEYQKKLAAVIACCTLSYGEDYHEI